MMDGISEKYADDFVRIIFLMFPLIWFMTNAILSIEEPQIFCFAFFLIIVNSIIFD